METEWQTMQKEALFPMQCCLSAFCTIRRRMAFRSGHLMTQHMLLSAQSVSQPVPLTLSNRAFWHKTLPPECCSVRCRRSPSRQSPCPCTTHWRGSQWTPGRQSPTACWRPLEGRTISGPGPWTTHTWGEKTGRDGCWCSHSWGSLLRSSTTSIISNACCQNQH